MKILETLKNDELEVLFTEHNDNKIVITLDGNIASSLTNSLFDVQYQPIYCDTILAKDQNWERLIIDLRRLKYLNSIGAAILIRFYGAFKKHPFGVPLLFKKGSEVAFILETLGFFLVAKPILVWDDLEEALNCSLESQ